MCPTELVHGGVSEVVIGGPVCRRRRFSEGGIHVFAVLLASILTSRGGGTDGLKKEGVLADKRIQNLLNFFVRISSTQRLTLFYEVETSVFANYCSESRLPTPLFVAAGNQRLIRFAIAHYFS